MIELGAAKFRLSGRRYVLPTVITTALSQVFEQPVEQIRVIEYSRYAKAHLGMSATTRPDRIFLADSGAEFVRNPEMMLHEYFHVLRQWGTGRLTRWRYLVESVRCGYWENSFECEARDFAKESVGNFAAIWMAEGKSGARKDSMAGEEQAVPTEARAESPLSLAAALGGIESDRI